MRSFLYLFGLVTFCLVVSAPSTAQTTVVDIPVPARVLLEIAEQPDSPLRIASMPRKLPLPTLVVEISTSDPKPIIGYVLVIESQGKKKVSINTRPEKLIEIGKPATHVLGIPPNENDPRMSVSVDLVRFEDGSKWGSDSSGGSKIIDSYLAGRNLAKKRLAALVENVGLDHGAFFAPIKAFGGFGLSGPVGMKFPVDRYRLEGYRSIIKALRATNKLGPEGQEFARKLELEENLLN